MSNKYYFINGKYIPTKTCQIWINEMKNIKEINKTYTWSKISKAK